MGVFKCKGYCSDFVVRIRSFHNGNVAITSSGCDPSIDYLGIKQYDIRSLLKVIDLKR